MHTVSVTKTSLLMLYMPINADGQGMWHIWRKGEVYTRFWCRNLRKRDDLGDQDVDGRIILWWIFRTGLWGLDGVGSG